MLSREETFSPSVLPNSVRGEPLKLPDSDYQNGPHQQQVRAKPEEGGLDLNLIVFNCALVLVFFKMHRVTIGQRRVVEVGNVVEG